VNYLAHAHRHLDRPYVVAGVCLPDWLRTIDRRARLVSEPTVGDVDDPRVRDVVHGLHAHHHDDARFHAHPAFTDATRELAALMRAQVDGDGRFRASVFAHVLLEQALDAHIDHEHPHAFDRFYAALADVDATLIAKHTVRCLSRATVDVGALLPLGITRFRNARFLYGYSDDAGLIERLHGAMSRAGLHAPPGNWHAIVVHARTLVRRHADVLLEPAHA
jgi:hypothetical protein